MLEDASEAFVNDWSRLAVSVLNDISALDETRLDAKQLKLHSELISRHLSVTSSAGSAACMSDLTEIQLQCQLVLENIFEDLSIWESAGWLLIAESTWRVYMLAIDGVTDATLPISRDFYYWQRRLAHNHRIDTLYYGLQTLPERLYRGIGNVSFQRVRSIIGKTQEQSPKVSLSMLMNAFSSPLRAEIKSKRTSLSVIRMQQASVLGLLVQEGHISLKSLDNIKSSVSKSIVIMLRSLDKLHSPDLTGPDTMSPMSRRSSSQVNDEMQAMSKDVVTMDLLTSSQSVIDLCASILNLNNAAMGVLETHGRPSSLAQYWIPVSIATAVSVNVIGTAWINRQTIYRYIVQARQTFWDFVQDWIVTPALGVWKTVRHEDTIQLTSAKSLSTNLDSLERMVCDYAREHNLMSDTEIATLPEQIRQGDMSVVLRRYEQNIKSPLKNIVAGDMVRTLLIQVQKTKVDLEIAMQALDKLLRSNELNFAFLALIPTLLIIGVSFRGLKHLIKQAYGMSAKDAHARLAGSLRNIERTTNKYENALTLPYQAHGYIIIELCILRKFGTKLKPQFRALFDEDLKDLSELSATPAQKISVISRMYRTYPFLK